MFLIHLDSDVPKEQFMKGNEQQRGNFQRHDWKLSLLSFMVIHSGLTLKRFFHKLIASWEHSAAQYAEYSAHCKGEGDTSAWLEMETDEFCLGSESGRVQGQQL